MQASVDYVCRAALLGFVAALLACMSMQGFAQTDRVVALVIELKSPSTNARAGAADALGEQRICGPSIR
jgi:hypothetical protein